MQRYQRGDLQAFRQLYGRHRTSVLRFVRQMSPHPDDNEEIAQETWMAVIKGRERYRPKARFATYLYSIVNRRVMDRWRRRGRTLQQEPEADELDALPGPPSAEPETRADIATLRTALIHAVTALPALQRATFLLRAEGGLNLEEIALVTGTSRETAKSRLRYALNRLRKVLEPWNE